MCARWNKSSDQALTYESARAAADRPALDWLGRIHRAEEARGAREACVEQRVRVGLQVEAKLARSGLARRPSEALRARGALRRASAAA